MIPKTSHLIVRETYTMLLRDIFSKILLFLINCITTIILNLSSGNMQTLIAANYTVSSMGQKDRIVMGNQNR